MRRRRWRKAHGRRGLKDAERRRRLNAHRSGAQGASEEGVVYIMQLCKPERASRWGEARASSDNEFIIGKAVSQAE